MKHLILIISIALLTGCVNPQVSKDLSSGAIGCSPDEITITNEKATANSIHTWTATCKGKTYHCSYHPSSNVNCGNSENK